jgi:hypothetical protein
MVAGLFLHPASSSPGLSSTIPEADWHDPAFPDMPAGRGSSRQDRGAPNQGQGGTQLGGGSPNTRGYPHTSEGGRSAPIRSPPSGTPPGPSTQTKRNKSFLADNLPPRQSLTPSTNKPIHSGKEIFPGHSAFCASSRFSIDPCQGGIRCEGSRFFRSLYSRSPAPIAL